ncbi:unnamed protein product [Ixodes persulcatus]
MKWCLLINTPGKETGLPFLVQIVDEGRSSTSRDPMFSRQIVRQTLPFSMITRQSQTLAAS